MSSTCHFCGQEFTNGQAVRAHLKGCEAYSAHKLRSQAKPKADEVPRGDSVGRQSVRHAASATVDERPTDGSFDPVRQLEQRLAAERLRLQLREVEDAHAELDRRSEAKDRERARVEEQAGVESRSAKAEQDAAQQRASEAADGKARREAAERDRSARRREKIQHVKSQAVESAAECYFIGVELKAKILQAIERELAALAVDDLPLSELIIIAKGVRDGLIGQADKIERAKKERAAKRERLIQHGYNYVSQELRAVDGLDWSTRLRIETSVKRELEEVTGEESERAIEDWVDEILDDEGIVDADDDDD